MILSADHVRVLAHHIGVSGLVVAPAAVRSMIITIKTSKMTKMIGHEMSSWAVPLVFIR